MRTDYRVSDRQQELRSSRHLRAPIRIRAPIRNPRGNTAAEESAYAGGRRSEAAMNRRGSTGLSCPQCGWNDVRVSYHASLLDYVLAILIFLPVRCRKCRLRFYRPWFMVRKAASGRAPAVETRSAVPMSSQIHMISPRTQPVSDIPLPASTPAAQDPVVQDSCVPCPDAGPILGVVPIPDLVRTSDVVPTTDAEALPVSQPEIPAAIPVPMAETTPPTVLLVDGDAAMRKLLAMLLHREGYAVRHAADSSQATVALSANGVDVVVANLSDDEQPIVIRRWLWVHPDLSIIALSSGAPNQLSLTGTSKNHLLTLPPPCRPRDVVQAVRALLDSSRTKALRMEPVRIEPSRATQCAPPSFAHTPRTGTDWQP